MHYYNFNIADYRKDTAHLSIIEHYIYRQLIDWYYLDELPIPKKTQQVMRRLSLGSENEPDLINVLDDFFVSTPKGYIHNKIENDLLEYKLKAENSRINGKKGGRPKGVKNQQVKDSEKPKKTQQVNSDNPDETQVKANRTLTNNQEPITINQIKKTKEKKASGFDAFWKAYPKGHKTSKKEAMVKWVSKNLHEKVGEILADIANRIANDDRWKKGFIPNSSTYLNQERWDGDIYKDPKIQSTDRIQRDGFENNNYSEVF